MVDSRYLPWYYDDNSTIIVFNRHECVRIHAGGAYAIVSRSLGRETGGVVGFMLYLAQSFAITMYIFGFREGWLGVFPTHSALLIDLCAFVSMVVIVRFFTDLAFKLQYLIFGITILSVLSVSWKPFDTRWSKLIGKLRTKFMKTSGLFLRYTFLL